MPTLDKRLPLAWFLGIPVSYFAVSYLKNFYPTPFLAALWTILIHSLTSLFFLYLLGRLKGDFRAEPVNTGMTAALFAALLAFVPFYYRMAKPFTTLFDSSIFHLSAPARLPFIVALIPAFFIAMILTVVARRRNWKKSRLFRLVDENLGGALLALVFFCIYLIFASIFNRPTFDADDIFFDADGNLYRWRFATQAYEDYYGRPAHPFILLIVRPLVGILALLFRGDTLFATFTLNALAAALCVFLVWYFVRHSIGNRLYALLIAALFGASTTQLAFGAIVESYIYLSAIALIFLILLLDDKPLSMQAAAGLIAFGLTISNVVQTFIAHFFVKRNIKQIVIYGLIVGVCAVPLTLLNNVVYPDSQPYFWDLSTLDAEGHNQFPATLQRADYLARVMALHSFVAPEPLVIHDGWPFPKIWMFRASIKKDPMQLARYETPLGNGLAFAWAGLLALGGILFLKNIFKQDNRYFFAFIFTLLFYFALHLRYGKDVFLYAANWTYLILLFLALAWRELARKRWFQTLLLAFILLLLLNNSHLYRTMMEIAAPFAQFPVWK